VPPFDVYEGASYLADAPEFFPGEAVFAVVVYPETGAAPTIAARNRRGQLLVAPDNGVLTLAADNCELLDVHVVENPDVMRTPPSPSFYGRDVVVAAAAHLAAGVPLELVGSRVDAFQRLPLHAPRHVGEGLVAGHVSIIDKNFGNVWTTIPQMLCRDAGLLYGDQLAVQFGGVRRVFPLVPTFADVPLGEPLAFFNSRGKLAFARNQRSLLELVPLRKGVPLEVERLALHRQGSVSTIQERAVEAGVSP